MFLSTAAFFLANVCVKQVAHVPAMEIVFFRCVIATALSVYGLRRAKASLVGENHLMLLLRGLFGTTALFCFFLTLQQMPLASADDTVPVADIYYADRDLRPERKRQGGAMDLLRSCIRRRRGDRAVRQPHFAVLSCNRHPVGILLGRSIQSRPQPSR